MDDHAHSGQRMRVWPDRVNDSARDPADILLDADPLDWLFGAEVASGEIRSALDTQDGWRSSYNGNANEILWRAKFAARCPWITCMIRLTSDECGMD